MRAAGSILTTFALICAVSTNVIEDSAHAESVPKSVKADQRIKTTVFDKDNVVVLHGTMGVSTMIMFDEEVGERIATVALGDTASWQAVPDQSKRYLFIKPLERDAATNMTIVTNRHIYNFALRASGPGSAQAVYKLRFVYPEDQAERRLLGQAREMASNPLLTRLWAHPGLMNAKYAFKGELINKPVRVADDGEHTYFEFAGEVPAIFRVKKDRSETLVNYRREGRVIIVDGVAAQWTLRNGNQATCVFNMRAQEEPPPADDMTPVQQNSIVGASESEDATPAADAQYEASGSGAASRSTWDLFGIFSNEQH